MGYYDELFEDLSQTQSPLGQQPKGYYDDLFAQAFPQAQEPGAEPGIVSSIARGIKAEQASLSGLFGFEEAQQRYLNEMRKYPSEVPDIESIEGVGDALTFAKERFFENLAPLATIFIPGGAAYKAARLAGAGTRTAKGAGIGAGFTADVALQAGETKEAITEAQGEEARPSQYMGPAILKAGLDYLPVAALAKSFGLHLPFQRILMKTGEDMGFWKRAGVNVTNVVGTEVPTETAQQWIDLSMQELFASEEFELLPEEKRSALLNAAAAAAVSSFPFGFGATFVQPRRTPRPEGEVGVGEVEGAAEGGTPLTTELEEESPAPTAPVEPPRDIKEEEFVAEIEAERSRVAAEEGLSPDALRALHEEKKQRLLDDLGQLGEEDFVLPQFKDAKGRSILTERFRTEQDAESKVDMTAQGESLQYIYATTDRDMGGIATRDGLFRAPRLGDKALTPGEVYLGSTNEKMEKINRELVTLGLKRQFGTISEQDYTSQMQAAMAEFKTMRRQGMELLETVKGLAKEFLPDRPIVLLDSAGGKAEEQTAKALGWFASNPNAYYIMLDTEKTLNPNNKGVTPLLYDTLAHEFGHAVMRRWYTKLPQKVQNAVKREWVNFVRSAETMPMREWVETARGLSHTDELGNAWQLNEAAGDRTAMEFLSEYLEPNRIGYQLSFPEWLANQATKYFQTKGATVRQEQKGLWANLVQELVRLYKRMSQTFKQTDTFDKFMELIRSEVKLMELDRQGVPKPDTMRKKDGGVAAKHYSTISPTTLEDIRQNRSLSTKIFPAIKLKNKANKARVKQVLKEVKANKWEEEAALQALEALPERFRWEDFVREVESRMVPLRKKFTTEYASKDNSGYEVASLARSLFGLTRQQDVGIFQKEVRDWNRAINRTTAEGVSAPVTEQALRQAERKYLNASQGLLFIHPSTIVYQHNGVALRDEVGRIRGEWNHFNDPQYYSHSRSFFVPSQQRSVVIEVQADGKPSNDPLKVLRTIREEIARASQFGMNKIIFPTEDTAAMVEGWDMEYAQDISDALGLRGESLNVDKEVGALAHSMVKKKEGNTLIPATKELIAPWRLYRNTIARYLQRDFDAKQIEWQGYTWWEVNVSPEVKTKPVLAFSQIPAINIQKMSKGLNQDVPASQKVTQEIDDAVKTVQKHSERTWKWYHKWLHTPLQIAEKFRQKVPGYGSYIANVEKMANTKNTIQAKAKELTDTWVGFGKEQTRLISSMALRATVESEQRGQRLDGTELTELRNQIEKEEGAVFTEEAWQHYLAMDEFFLETLEDIESGLLYATARQFGQVPETFVDEWLRIYRAEDGNPLAADSFVYDQLAEIGDDTQYRKLIKALRETADQVEQMRDRNYFPLMRFGRYYIKYKAKEGGVNFEDQTFAGGQVFYFETFQTKKERDAALTRVEKDIEGATEGAFRKDWGVLRDNEFNFLGMPPVLFNYLKTNLDLTAEQMAEMDSILLNWHPGKTFLKHLQKRKTIEGYSKDALRAFGAYAMSASNHISRIRHMHDLDQSLTEMSQQISATEGDRTTYEELANYARQHYDYIMNPTNDWAQIRALGFMYYLGANVKSAAVNLTQVPIVTYAVLAGKYGDGRAVRELSKSFRTTLSSLRNAGKISPEHAQLIDTGTNEGWLDESFAASLAGIQDSPTLSRTMVGMETSSVFNKISYYSSFMFHKAENFNRRVTAIAAFELEMKRLGKTSLSESDRMQQAIEAAKDAVQKSQFEYAKWNRPELMRGKRSVIFLFWQYMQHLSYLSFGGTRSSADTRAAIRVWMMLGLAAGLQGLPFAEHILDILDFAGTKAKELAGMKNPRVQLREDLRELFQALDVNPDMMMHGLSRYYGLGPINVLGALGAPVPAETDISGSLSAGRILPGLQEALSPSRSSEEKFARTVIDVMGPAAAIPYNLYTAMASDDPDTWKRIERTLPIFMKSASKALRWADRGEETLRGDATFLKFDPANSEHIGEMWAQALGFTPTRLSRRYELYGAVNDAKRYWANRRGVVLERLSYATFTGDREGLADAYKQLREFNASVQTSELRELTIDRKTIDRSIKSRTRSRERKAQLLPLENKYVPLYLHAAEVYGQTP